MKSRTHGNEREIYLRMHGNKDVINHRVRILFTLGTFLSDEDIMNLVQIGFRRWIRRCQEYAYLFRRV